MTLSPRLSHYEGRNQMQISILVYFFYVGQKGNVATKVSTEVCSFSGPTTTDPTDVNDVRELFL